MKTPLLEDLSADERDALLALATRRLFKAGEAILAEGDPGRGLYILAEGTVAVEKATISGAPEVLSRLGAGECFGEMALVDSKPRSATVRAVEDALVLGFDQEKLDAFFGSNPDVHRRVLRNLVLITSLRLRLLDEALVKSAYDSTIVMDAACRILERSRMTERPDLIGQGDGPDDVVGRDLFEVVPELGEGLRRQLLEVIASGGRAVLNIEREREGEAAYFEVTVAVSGPGRTALGIRNVTETRALENRLIRTEKLAMSGQMAAEIGHDLRNFLTVLIGHVDLLRVSEVIVSNERASRSVTIVGEQLEKIERFASGLMELGVLRMAREPSDLNDLIARLISFIQGQARFQRVTFTTDLARNLPAIHVDPGQVQQVFLNLYTNAAEAMPSGTVRTTTRLRTDLSAVEVVVRDEGPGMTPEVLKRVFDSGFTTKEGGHGHGLAICRRIVEHHNGTILAESEPGHGSTFRLSFRL